MKRYFQFFIIPPPHPPKSGVKIPTPTYGGVGEVWKKKLKISLHRILYEGCSYRFLVLFLKLANKLLEELKLEISQYLHDFLEWFSKFRGGKGVLKIFKIFQPLENHSKKTCNYWDFSSFNSSNNLLANFKNKTRNR